MVGCRAILIAAALAVTQAPILPAPASQPESIGDTSDFPYLPPPAGARLISTTRIDEPLELKQATEDDEAVLAGMSYVKKTYERGAITSPGFVPAYRDGFFAAGWRLLDVTKLAEPPVLRETVNVAAHFGLNGRNLYARLSQEPDRPFEINVADVGAEDWESQLETMCRVRLHSLHFDRDRATIRSESTPTLEKAAEVLKAKRAWRIEVQGHMDNIGAEGDAMRQLLSEARAKAVAAWLTAHGVPAARITTKGYGKLRPIADNDSDLGRARNRRIELVRLGCS
jgi:OOP family OmpA-OmpF porin